MRLLLIEDSAKLQRSLVKGLRKLGYAVDTASRGEDGLWLATENEYDVVLLDLMLPDIDGLEVLRRLRELGRNHHVLILSARDVVEDRVRGLNLGADDYLIKPFAFEELCARIQALIRRGYAAKSPALELGLVRLDTASRRAFVGEEELHLTPREYGLLELLSLRRGEVVSRREMWERLYDFEATAESNVVDVLVYSLRKKLAAHAATDLILTRRGLGYEIPAAGGS